MFFSLKPRTGPDESELDDTEGNMEECYNLPSLLEESIVGLEKIRLPRTLPKKIATIVTDIIKHVTNGDATPFDQVRESVVEILTTNSFDEGMHKLYRNVTVLVIDGNTEVGRVCKSLL